MGFLLIVSLVPTVCDTLSMAKDVDSYWFLPIIFHKVEAFTGVLVARYPVLLCMAPCGNIIIGNMIIGIPHFSKCYVFRDY